MLSLAVRRVAIAAALVLASVATACGRHQKSNPAAPFGSEPDPDMVKHSCYAPQLPERVVPEDIRKEWIAKINQYAVEAEQIWGVPAASLIAMSALESGYGNTLVAREANNPFGYKYIDASMAHNRAYYVLSCQPEEDPNNKYIKFDSVEDAFLYVGMRLATVDEPWVSYKKPTDRYVVDRQKGTNIVVAVDRWIDGIANAGYNYDPKNYSSHLKQLVRDGVKGSWQPSEDNNLLRYSEPVMPRSLEHLQAEAFCRDADTYTQLALATPRSGMTVTGVAELQIEAPPSIKKVVIHTSPADGSYEYALATLTGCSPLVTRWHTSSLKSGPYVIRLVGHDAHGKVAAEVRVPVNIRN